MLPEKEKYRDTDPHLCEIFDKIEVAIKNMALQTNTDPNQMPDSPPQIQALGVTYANGMANVAITDGGVVGGLGVGITYFLEYSSTADFANPYVVQMGPSRNTQLQLGAQTLFFRAYSQYPGSASSAPTYFGSPPTAVALGGSAPPAQQPSAGSGYGGGPTQGGGIGYGKGEGEGDQLQPIA